MGVETELLTTKGTLVYIGLGAANQSAAIWGPDASELKPEQCKDAWYLFQCVSSYLIIH